MAGILGYIFGAFFALVIVGFILWLFYKVIGGFKWGLVFVGLCLLMAAYTHFPELTIILGAAMILGFVGVKLFPWCPHCRTWVKDRHNNICPNCHNDWTSRKKLMQ